MEKVILDAYKAKSYPGAQKLYKMLRLEGHNVKLKDVTAVIKKQTSYQLHKKQPKKVKAHMIAFTPDQIWQLDLLDMTNFAHENNGKKWILLGIDVFTRRAFAEAIKNKTAQEVLKAFISIIRDEDAKPEKLITDNGSEFTNKEFQKFLKDNSIIHPTLGIVDRLSRTIKEKIFKTFTDLDTTKWASKLESIILSYNVTPHIALGDIAPIHALEHIPEIVQINMKKNVRLKHQFKVGMLVRRRLAKSTFTKGYKQIWGKQTNHISSISGVNAVLDNGDKVKLNDLQHILEVDESIPEVSGVQKAEKKARIRRKMREEGVEETNIVDEGKKRRKVPVFRDPGDKPSRRKQKANKDEYTYWVAGD